MAPQVVDEIKELSLDKTSSRWLYDLAIITDRDRKKVMDIGIEKDKGASMTA